MKTLEKHAAVLFCVSIAMLLLPTNVYAWQPGGNDLTQAIDTGDFTAYLTNTTAWLSQKAANLGKTPEATLTALLKDPVFHSTLDRRHFIFKTGADQLGAFAKATPANKVFLTWLLNDAKALELYLEGSVPVSRGAREQNGYRLSTKTLERWQDIYNADPDSKEGLYLRLAIATAIAPPGTGSPGAGQAKTPVGHVERYMHFKTAHKNKELFPSFDNLTVWEYQKVVQSGASNEDLAWARQMINSWRPDLRKNELVVNSTSEVWYRRSPVQFNNSYKNVLAGGGKCGPRSSWAVMICQAFGVPSIGVGQPAHACVAYKTAYPMTEPQPGSAWKVGYGRGWPYSKLEGMSGPDFLASVAERSNAEQFSKIEHLRWFASSLTAKDQSAAIMDIAHKIQKADLTASAKAAGADRSTPLPPSKPVPEEPFKPVPGVLHVEAETFSESFADPLYPTEQKGAVYVYDCFTGGKQVNFQRNMKISRVDYKIDVPATGIYGLTMRVATPNYQQSLDFSCGAERIAIIRIPNSAGLWATTKEVSVKLNKGPQTLRFSGPSQRGIAIRWFELKAE